MNAKFHSLAVLSASLIALTGSADQRFQPYFKISSNQISRTVAKGGTQHNSSPIGGYSVAQIRAAYGINGFPGQGEGQTIAVIDAYGNPTMEADLNTFSRQYNLPQTGEFNFRVVKAEGSSSTDSTNYSAYVIERGRSGGSRGSSSGSQASGWMVETSLDVEWAHAIAPKAAILLVVAKSTGNSDLMTAVKTAIKEGANVISMSFGGAESTTGKVEHADDEILDVRGVTFVASSGDNGAGVSYPASSPYVLAVGGTNLPLDSDGNITGQETAWSGSGGGVSAVERTPAYQQPLGLSMRGVPDVAYDADPKTGFAIYFSNPFTVTDGKKTATVSGWFEVGGTSAGSPQWAGLIADANSQRSTPLDTLTALYALAGPRDNSSYFNPITSGCDGKAVQDCATPGYNTVTGLGSPAASALLPALASY